MFWYNVISNNPSYYFKMYISEIKKKKKKKEWLFISLFRVSPEAVRKIPR